MKEPPAHGLLRRLEALVQHDRALSGLNGYLAVGVASDAGTDTWWHAEFGTETKTWTSNARPDRVPESALIMNEATADKIMNGESCPDAKLIGDARFYNKFINRYLVRNAGLNQRLLRFTYPTKDTP